MMVLIWTGPSVSMVAVPIPTDGCVGVLCAWDELGFKTGDMIFPSFFRRRQSKEPFIACYQALVS